MFSYTDGSIGEDWNLSRILLDRSSVATIPSTVEAYDSPR